MSSSAECRGGGGEGPGLEAQRLGLNTESQQINLETG